MTATDGILSEAGARWLEGRGLDPETALQYGVHTRPAKGSGELIVFPYLREGEVVNHKYRPMQGDKLFWQDKLEDGAKKCWWNEDCLRDKTLNDQPLIITEGECDALATIMAGFPRTISPPDGAPPKRVSDKDADKYQWIEDTHDLLRLGSVKEIILAVDNDGPGDNLLHDLSFRLTRARCKWVKYPFTKHDRTRRCKDMNETLENYGVEGVRKVIENAKWLTISNVAIMSDLPPVPPMRVFTSGIPGLNKRMRFAMGYFTVVTGIPGHGKSTFINDVVCSMAQEHRLKTVFASFEQMPQRDHRRNLRSWYCGNHADLCDEQSIALADKWIDETFVFVTPSDDEECDLDWLLDRLEAAVIQHNCSMVVIDPWDEIDHDFDGLRVSETQYITRAIKTLKRFAQRLAVHVVVVAHPTKMRKNEQGGYSMPSLYDVSGSARWYNKADLGLIVHRESMLSEGGVNEKAMTVVRVAKSRYHDLFGMPGDVTLDFDFPSRHYKVREVI